MADHDDEIRSGNTGAGDNFDPDVHAVDDADLHAPTPGASRPADGSGGQGMDEDDGDGRASEIDDVTQGMSREGMTAEQVEADLADQIDSIDVSDVDEITVDVSDVDVLALLQERDDFKSHAQRIQAEFDNFRRQSTIRTQQESDRATGRLAEALLPVLDAAEAAYLRHPEEVGPLLNQMLSELKKHGLETLDLDGQPFDPEVAEAVAHEPAGGGEPVVSEVLRSGYRWKDRTLRPAMVRTTD